MTHSNSDKTNAVHIGDLIDVPPVKTVVQLEDLLDPSLRGQMAQSFILTDEVQVYLRRFLVALETGRGFAAFLRGHYGTGKSHFLAFLELLLTGDVPPDHFRGQDPELFDLLEAATGHQHLVAAISLVQHSAREPLEQIVTDAFSRTPGQGPLPFLDATDLDHHIDTFRYHLSNHYADHLALFLLEHGVTEEELFSPDRLDLLEALSREVRYPFRPDPGRDVRFTHLFEALEKSHYTSVVLLLDELSEFLHAKTGPALAEDIRFLQFLGELTAERPMYIICAIQEYLEAAEYGLPGEMIRKIKDRYPNTFELSSSHIEEIVAQRLIRHKPGADQVIETVYSSLHDALTGFPIPKSRFMRVYPVHPATTILLERLKPLLSQGRGIIDFIHNRLRGSETRGITGMLDMPADQLLTPDVIFDHFRTRIRENVEIAEYDSTVYAWFESHLESLFPNPGRRKLATRLVKLLILLAISPEPRPYSVRTLTQALLVRISRIDPDANMRAVQDILQQLVNKGAYVERIARHPEGPLSFDDIYRISLRADLTVLVTRRIRAAMASLESAPPVRIYETIAPDLALESLPFHQLSGRGPQPYVIQWQRTSREGLVTLGGLHQVDVATLTKMVERLREEELDWVLFVGVTYDVDMQRTHVEQVLLPALRRAKDPAARTVLFWIPRPIGFEGQDGAFLRETLARRAVLDQVRHQAGTSQARAFAAHLEKALANDLSRIEGIFHRAYYQGSIVSIAGEGEDVSTLGRPFFEQTLLAVFTPVLSARYPDHARCAPMGRPPTLDDVQAIVENLFRTGAYQPRQGDTDRFATRLVSLLRPLGLLKKSGAVYTLSIDTSKPGPARTFLQELDDEPRPLEEVQKKLRKGSFGLIPAMFQLLTLGLAFGGTITCYSKGTRRDPSELGALTFGQIDAVSRSALADLDLSPLADLPFFPDKKSLRGTLTPQKQELVWKQVQTSLREIATLSDEVREGMHRVPDVYRDRLDLEALEDYVRLLDRLRASVHEATSPARGLEAFLRAVRACPVCKEAFTNLREAARFFRERLGRYLTIDRYCALVGDLPPTLDFAVLRQHLEEVRERLRDRSLPVAPSRFARLEAAFRKFQSEYVKAYAEAHERQRGAERFAPFVSLRNTARYRLLEKIASLSALAVDARKDTLDRKVATIVAGRCDALSRDALFSHPICTCGFRLGQVSPLPPPQTLDDALSEAVNRYVEVLAQSSNLAAIKRAEEEQRHIGHDTVAKALTDVVQTLEPLAATTSSLKSSQIHQLLACFDDHTLRAIDEALKGISRIRERPLEPLVETLRDRCIRGDEALDIFRHWLEMNDESGEGDTYYRFTLEETERK